MFANLEIFRMSHAMATHAGARQTIIAQNIANADTPGYRARDLQPFAASFRQDKGGLIATRVSHLNGSHAGEPSLQSHTSDTIGSNPNGNTVTLEQEMLKAVEVKRQHDRAIAVYKSSLSILRTSLGRR